MRRTMRRLCSDGQFDDTSIEIIAVGPSARSCGGFDFFQVNQLTFGLRDDFVFDYQDVALPQALVLSLESVEEKARQGVARFYFRFNRERDDVEFRGGWIRGPTAYALGYIRSPLRGCLLPSG